MPPDLFDPPKSPQIPAAGAPRLGVHGGRLGRPPKAVSKRSIDLARYVEAEFEGLTPGQQEARLSMVTARELKAAKADAQELEIYVELPPMMLAMVVKAAKLAIALGCERKEAWLLLQKGREGLMPYVHQKRPAAADDSKMPARPIAYLVPDGDASQLADFSVGEGDGETLEILDLSPTRDAQVNQHKSTDDS